MQIPTLKINSVSHQRSNMDEQIKKLEQKIMSQGKKISKLKNIQPELSDNEYKRLIDRLRYSEAELLLNEKQYLEEIEELKNEILYLLSKDIL